MNDKTEQEYEALKDQRNKFEKERNSEILQLNNDIKRIQKELEEKFNDKNTLDSQIEESTNLNATKNLNVGKILIAIENLFDRCAEGTGH